MRSFRKALRSPKGSVEYKMSHNAVEDFKQYEEWKAILGEDNMPKSLADFQELKYNNIKDYCELKDKAINNKLQQVSVKSDWDNDLPPRGQVPYVADYDVYSFVAKELGIDEKLAEEYADSVFEFTNDYYDKIRAYQRNESDQIDDTVVKLSDAIETYIKQAPRWSGGETYRGCSISADELASYEEGKNIEMGGTSSWSDSEQVSMIFAESNISDERPCPVIYHCDTQTRGTGIRHLSMFENESEVICSKESNYNIVSIVTAEDYVHIYLEEKYYEHN